MKGTIKRPIRTSFIVGCVLFVTVLCLSLVMLNFSVYEQTLYRHYENSITNILNYTSAHIDVDDLEECIATGKESEKFKELQSFLDNVKESLTIDYLYVIVPLNTDEKDNVLNVIDAMTEEDYKENNGQPLVHLNELAGDTYTAKTAEQYLDAYQKGEKTFFADNGTWGNEYTGMLPLYDAKGNKVAALCVDLNIKIIHTELTEHILYTLGVTVLIGVLFTLVFLIWARRNISKPIRDLEGAVTKFAAISHLRKSPDQLVLKVPPIHTNNEVESLAEATVKMSEDIRDYAKTLSDAQEESKRQSIALSEALDAAQSASRAKTTFLSNMSHEIRTPMNAIIGLDNIALNDPTLSDSTRDYLEKIGSSAQHLLNIINDILDVSRIESGRMTIRSEEFSFAKMLEQVNTIISGQCREKGLSYNCKIAGEVDDYYIGDDMKLRQVLINILGNSVKFTPEGGSISFEVRSVAHFDDNVTLRFIMADTGIGMSKEFLPKIFESFSQEDTSNTSKYGNTGLGMSITKSLVELMHGDIRVESEKGKGTTFSVTITLKESERRGHLLSDVEIDPGEMSALVIDDDPVACEHARLTLGQTGITCETAASGAEAIRMVELRQARREPYSLILADWRMPEMDGLEVTKQLRSIVGNDSVILILTAYNWDDIIGEAMEAGVDSFVPKPLFAGTVLNEYKAVYRKYSSKKKAHKAELSGRRILIAEDVAINAEILRVVLEERGMTSDIAENGEEAVELFASHPEGYYDAVLMDMRMPVMDGLEATGAIRAMNRADSKTVPIIALTANAFDEDVQRSLQGGLNAHLSKPVDSESLYETLGSLIDAP